jgi:hypothetical protein
LSYFKSIFQRWCQGRSRNYQTRPYNDYRFLTAKSRDTNKDTNTLRHSDMSALPPKADMCGAPANVRFVPKADIRESTLGETERPPRGGLSESDLVFSLVALSAVTPIADKS